MKKLVVANWKSHKNRAEVVTWMKTYGEWVSSHQLQVDVGIAPSSSFLEIVATSIKSLNLQASLVTQTMSSYPPGSYTGELSTRNVDAFQVQYAILGHSERRTYEHETSQDVASKVRECLDASITPIVCVTASKIDEQARLLDEGDTHKIIIAFEPIEHIGTGVADDHTHIQEVNKLIRIAFEGARYMYGGSVSKDTDAAILHDASIDGYLVGGASLDCTDFTSLLSSFQ